MDIVKARSRSVVAAMVGAAAVTAQFVSGKAVRDALFLTSHDISALPAMLLVTSAFSIALVVANARAARSVGPGTWVPATFAASGALLSYGPSRIFEAKRMVGYVQKVLNGAKPADLPIEQPVKFELVINLKTARALGLNLPLPLLDRADELIE